MPNPGPGPMPQVCRPVRPNSYPPTPVESTPYNGDFDQQPPRRLETPSKEAPQPKIIERRGCVFAKSCNLPDGVIDHCGLITPELLKNYGDWAVLSSAGPLTAGGTALRTLGSSISASAIAERLGGQITLGLIEGMGAVAAGAAVGTVAMLMPNSLSSDSAFYTQEQYFALTLARTRVRLHVQQLPGAAVTAYGFYTGGKPDWENVPKIKAEPRGEQYVADIGQGVELIWTPAADPNELGIPALEGAPPLPNIWVLPPTPAADLVLGNPVHPPDYQDAIVWFPNTDIQPIYISLSVMGDHSYHPAPKGLTAFPDAQITPRKTPLTGGSGLRKRWKSSDGTIYEWDSQHGKVEKYNKRGKHLGEFDPTTGEQTKQADKTREVEP